MLNMLTEDKTFKYLVIYFVIHVKQKRT